MPRRSQSTFTEHSWQLAPRQASVPASALLAFGPFASALASIVLASSRLLASLRASASSAPASLIALRLASKALAITFETFALEAA
jgi:hypothetical protein